MAQKNKMRIKLVFKDVAGNKLYKRFIKSRNTYQYYAKNRKGRLVTRAGFNTLARRAGLNLARARMAKV
jgi:hypothetical protein